MVILITMLRSTIDVTRMNSCIVNTRLSLTSLPEALAQRSAECISILIIRQEVGESPRIDNGALLRGDGF